MTAQATPHIEQMRKHLMETLADLRNREQPMEPDRARAVAQVAGVLVDTAKVEIEYIKATGGERSHFLEPTHMVPAPDGPANGITSITRHQLRG